jgi:hypothetical protein
MRPAPFIPESAMLPRLSRTLLSAALTVGLSGPVMAATSEAEIDTFAEIVKSLVDREVDGVADRQLAAFIDLAGERHAYARILRLHFARTFALSRAGEEGETLKKTAEQLEKELSSLVNDSSLPDTWRDLIKLDPMQELLNLVKGLQSNMDPGKPPPDLNLMPDGFSQQIAEQVELCMQLVKEAIPYYQKRIDEYEPTLQAKWFELENPSRNEQKFLFEGIRRRLALANIYYLGIKTMLEVELRAEAFQLPAELVSKAQAFLGEIIAPLDETLDDWDFNYADYNPTFKHRILVIRLEHLRHGASGEDANARAPEFQDIEFFVTDMLDMDVNNYPAQFRTTLVSTKATFLGELMLLAQAWEQQDATAAKTLVDYALQAWEKADTEMKRALRDRSDKITRKAGELFINAARFFHLRGNQQAAMQALSDVTALKNQPWRRNAQAWQDHMLQGDGGPQTVDWGATPQAGDAESAISLFKTLRKAARNTADAAKAQSFRMQAAIALRNAIYGLQQSEDREAFIEFGPTLYQHYAYILRDMGWHEHAAIVAEQGLRAVFPYWGEEKDQYEGNPWGDPLDREKLNEAGLMVQRLSNDYWMYSNRLKRFDNSLAARDRYSDAVELRKRIDPNAEGAEKTEIVTAIQDGEYENAIKLAKQYSSKATTTSEQIWYQRITLYAYYLWFDELVKDETADQTTISRVEQEMRQELATLEQMIAPELAKGEQADPEARKAKNFSIVVDIGSLHRNEDWAGIIDKLGPDFWQDPPEVPIQVKMLNMLTNAVYKQRLAISNNKDDRWNPELILKPWPDYQHAYQTLLAVEKTSGSRMKGNRQRMTVVYQAVSIHARGFVKNIENGLEQFQGMPLAKLYEIARAATITYIDLLTPTLADNTPVETYIGLAQSLWEVDAKQRAVGFYEKYLDSAAQREDLQAFAADPAGVVDPIGELLLSARRQYEDRWMMIRDLLIDKPGFIEQYERVGGKKDQLSEAKRDFIKAHKELSNLYDELEEKQALIGTWDQLQPKLEDLTETVKHLSWGVQFTTRLVEAYMDIGDTERAVQLASELIAYDPLYPPYMTVFVEGVLLQDAPSREQLQKAQQKSARVRNMTRGQAERIFDYWTAYCQVMETSVLLNDMDVVNRSLHRLQINNDFPIYDLRLGAEEPIQARNEGDITVWKRFLRIYDTPGISFPKPYRIEQQDDGTTIAIPAQVAE